MIQMMKTSRSTRTRDLLGLILRSSVYGGRRTRRGSTMERRISWAFRSDRLTGLAHCRKRLSTNVGQRHLSLPCDTLNMLCSKCALVEMCSAV